MFELAGQDWAKRRVGVVMCRRLRGFGPGPITGSVTCTSASWFIDRKKLTPIYKVIIRP